MKAITKEMIKIYNLKEYDFMGYKLTKNATFHHIVKKEHGGKETIENGAVLETASHQYLHVIEYKEIERFILINKMLKIINNQGHAPTREQIEIIDYILREFEEEHEKDLNSKGKPIIKKEFKERILK
jgi:hypothetical protein